MTQMQVARAGRYGLSSAQKPWGEYALAIFALLQTVSLSRASFALLFGDWVNEVAGTLNAGSVFAAIYATVWFARKYGVQVHDYPRLWLGMVLMLVIANCARGFAQGLLTKYIVYDTFSYLIILCFVILGSIPEAFEVIKRQWFWVLLAAIPLNLVALTDLSTMTQELSTGARVARETISYRTQNALDVVVLCSAFAFQYSYWRRLVVALAFTLVLLQQTLYQKRLETAFYLLLIAVIATVWMSAPPAMSQRLRRIILQAIAVIIGLLTVTSVAMSQYILPQAQALLSRLTGSANDVVFTGGFARYTFFDNERFTMVRDSLDMMEPYELFIGRGMGGGVELHEFNSRVLDSSEREVYWNSYYLEDYGYFGRRGFEMGMAMPILKGGIVLFLVYYSAFLVVLFHAPVIARRFEDRIALALVCLYWVYTAFGGDFALSMVFQMTNTAACLGACLAAIGRSTATVNQSIVAHSPKRRVVERRYA